MPDPLPPTEFSRQGLFPIGPGSDPTRRIPAHPTGTFPRPFGPYTLLREAGRGGMGLVFEARDERLGRRVALKSLAEGNGDEVLVERLQREARAVARLRHANVVSVYDVGEIAGVPYLTMDFVDGQSLADRMTALSQQLQEGFVDLPILREQVRILRDVAAAVGAAHDEGIVHRDLKPGNVLVNSQGVPFVTDFGLAKDVRLTSHGTKTPSITITGTILGTPGYMSPEQARGDTRNVSPRSDVFSLGVILYEMLCGVPPFAAESLYDLLDMIAKADPVPPRRRSPRAPRELETICLKCLEKDPAHRYADGNEVAADLGRYLSGESILARRSSLLFRLRKSASRNRPAAASLTALLLLLLALGVVLLVRSRRSAHEREAAVKEARALLGRHEFDQAIGRIDSATEQFGDRPELIELRERAVRGKAGREADAQRREELARELAVSDEELRGVEESEREADKALEDTAATLLQAFVDLSAGNRERSIQAVDRALDAVGKAEEASPEYYKPHYFRGMCLLRLWQGRDPRGDLDAAAEEFTFALDEQRRDARSLQGLIEARMAKVREAWARQPGRWSMEGTRMVVAWDTWADLASPLEALAKEGRRRLAEAEDDGEDPGSDARSLAWTRGALFACEGKAAEAVRELEAVLDPADLSGSARQLEGECFLYSEGKAEEAARRFEAAQRVLGDQPLLLAELGQALARDEEWEGAASAWEGLVDARPDEPLFRAHLGLALLEADQEEEGRKALARALEDGLPDGPLRAFVEGRLK